MAAGPGVGFEFPVRKVSWLKRDVLLFNISIGCKADEPHFVYEGARDFSVFPTLPLGLVFKLNTQETIDFHSTQGAVEIPGVPKLDPSRLVDGDRTIQLIKSLPTTSQGRDFEFHSKVIGVYDKGNSGTIVRSEDVLVDVASGEVYAKNIGSLFYVGQGNWGGPRGPASQKLPPISRKADWTFEFGIEKEAAHLYRLNGDYNPLHATPEYGERMGYGGIIMHGVYAYNRIAHSLVREMGGSKPTSLREFSAKFAGPVKPGDCVKVEVWRIGTESNGWAELRWTAKVVQTERPCLTDGRAQIRFEKPPSKM